MRQEIKTINIYLYQELSEDAKQNVIDWLNEEPIEYETDYGGFKYLYWDELPDIEIADHCDINEYEFLENGTLYMNK